MQVSVTFRNMESKEVWRDYVEEKLSKLKKYLDYPLEANVILTTEKHRQIAEVNLVANRFTINARDETEDMSSAIDGVVDKLERQLLKYKEKSRRQKPVSPPGEAGGRAEISSAGNFSSGAEKIPTQKMQVKAMSVEEAVQQMQNPEKDFTVFTNIESEDLNILYRMKDGRLGLIVPEEE